MARHTGSPAALPPTLVVGGAGFIGARVVEALLARGAEVRVLDDLSRGRTDALPLHDPNLELRAGDMLDAAAVASAMDGMRRCLHVAAQTPSPRQDAWAAAQTNVLGFVNVLEAARTRGVDRVVYASSASVYGDAPDRPLTEEDGAHPLGAAGMEKLVAEGYAALYQRRYGLKLLGLRYFNVYGPGAPRNSVIARFVERLARRRPALILGDGHETRDFVHVEDAAGATVAALASDFCGVCNVATGERTDVRHLAKMIGQALDVRPLLHFGQARPHDAVYAVGDPCRMLAQLDLVPPRALRTGLAELASDWLAQERLIAAAAAVTVTTGAALRGPARGRLPARIEHRHGRLS